MITYKEFENVELDSGTITKVEEFPRAKKPAFKVWTDLIGFPDSNNDICLVTIDPKVPNGQKLY